MRWGWSQSWGLNRLASGWGRRAELKKPEQETELPDSELAETEGRAAIERERARREMARR